MSVAVGIAQPFISKAAPLLKAINTSAGTSIPPMAAMPGRVICESEERCPSMTSRLTSSPMTKKKIAIRPSLTQSKRGLAMCSAPKRTSTGVCKKPV